LCYHRNKAIFKISAGRSANIFFRALDKAFNITEPYWITLEKNPNNNVLFWRWNTSIIENTDIFSLLAPSVTANNSDLCFKVESDDQLTTSSPCNEKHFFICERRYNELDPFV